MDNHPIPQDITGFQFKLIGAMTVRQFVYLAAGSVVGALFLFIFPIPFIIGLIIAVISFSIGASFAFVPIGGRPMDTMIRNLFKALFAPTEYVYKKAGGDLSTTGTPATTEAQKRTETQSESSVNSVDKSVPSVITGEFEASIASTPPVQSIPSQTSATTEEQSSPLNTQNPTSVPPVDNSVGSVVTSLPPLPPPPVQTIPVTNDSSTADLQKLLLETKGQKEALENELIVLKQKLEGQKQKKFTPGTVTSQTQNVRKVPQGLEKTAGVLSTPMEPNLISGIIKDPRGNPLQNILVEVKDSQENPVRAFKTNGLGQFASATSLSNGKYVLIFEDPEGHHKFDAVEIEANGGPLPPLEIISVDPREELRRELFN